MARPVFDRDKAIKILVDAQAFGDTKACQRWKITRQTLRNYRRRLEHDPELLREFARLQREAERSWKLSRQRFLERALTKAIDLAADEKDLDKLTRAIERVGNLDVASEALGVSAGNHQASAQPAADAHEDAGGPEPVCPPVLQ